MCNSCICNFLHTNTMMMMMMMICACCRNILQSQMRLHCCNFNIERVRVLCVLKTYVLLDVVFYRNSTSAEWATAMSWPATWVPLLHGVGVTGLLPTASWSRVRVFPWTWQTCETDNGSTSLGKTTVTAAASNSFLFYHYGNNRISCMQLKYVMLTCRANAKQKSVLFVQFPVSCHWC